MTTRVLLCAALAVATLALYAPVRALPFVLYDDPQYLIHNPPVLAGLTLDGLRWAFTSTTLAAVQVGFQSTADRYTCLPQIGVWLALVWSAQLAYRTDDLALWQRALAVTEANGFSHTEAGIELAARGRNGEAVAQLTETVRLAPERERAQANYAARRPTRSSSARAAPL